ncbi:MAG TPA: hypothetical protein PKB10_12355, partial [Tepidisphaeraceae bacterium]|nr:hypothetical protein [Tepidisphaeraceae bacterium]
MKVSRLGLVFSIAGLFGCAAGGAAGQPAADPGNVDLARYPSISPDGSSVVFSWRGDLWRAPGGGGTAIHLPSGPADELS